MRPGCFGSCKAGGALGLTWKMNCIWKGSRPNEPPFRGLATRFLVLPKWDFLDTSSSIRIPTVVMPSKSYWPSNLFLNTYNANTGSLICCGTFLTNRKSSLYLSPNPSPCDCHVSIFVYIRGGTSCVHLYNLLVAIKMASSLTSRNIFWRYVNKGI